tara:strand:- start:91 stop:486 length:396 start_codon:yes stop_codon:yes gene_type:complete
MTRDNILGGAGTSDEYYGTLTIKDLEDLVDKGSTKEKRAARTELKEREAKILLEKEELKKKEAREAIKKEEKKETKKAKVIRVLEKQNREMTAKQLVGLTGMNKNTVRGYLVKAAKRGDIVRVKRGVYRFK